MGESLLVVALDDLVRQLSILQAKHIPMVLAATAIYDDELVALAGTEYEAKIVQAGNLLLKVAEQINLDSNGVAVDGIGAAGGQLYEWAKAEKHLQYMEEAVAETANESPQAATGMLFYTGVLAGLRKRFDDGERSGALFDEIMDLS